MNDKKPRFITVEGIEGAGKTTAFIAIEALLRERGIDYCLTREPGGTLIGESVRDILLNHNDSSHPMHADTELLLLFASRAQHVQTVILPALRAGQWVVSDRFTDASYAYQGGGRGVDKQRIAVLEDLTCQGLKPDITLLLDADVPLCLQRLEGRGERDRIEQEAVDFFERVRSVYLERAESEPERFRVMDASQPLEVVAERIRVILREQ